MLFYFVCICVIIGICVIINYKDILCNIKCYLAKKNIDKYNDKLVRDKNENIRAEVAKHCDKKYLDILVNDKDYNVRYEVAKRGFDEHLDILIYIQIQIFTLRKRQQNLICMI